VVRNGNHDGIDVAAFEQLSVIMELLRTAAAALLDLLRREIQVRLVNVANRHHGRVLVLQKRVKHLVATVAEPNEAQPDLFVSTPHAPRAQRRGRRNSCRGRGPGEIAPSDFVHDDCFPPVSDINSWRCLTQILGERPA
jgi:hypothetical protein